MQNVQKLVQTEMAVADAALEVSKAKGKIANAKSVLVSQLVLYSALMVKHHGQDSQKAQAANLEALKAYETSVVASAEFGAAKAMEAALRNVAERSFTRAVTAA